MGNTVAAPTSSTDELHDSSCNDEDSAYQWPENLYLETRDMAAASFLVYTFGYILAVARLEQGLKGMDVDEKGHAKETTQLNRSFTPHQVADIVKENATILAQAFPNEFSDPTRVEKSLELLQERARESGLYRPLTLEEYDDKHQRHEMVYAVAKDDVNRRITLVFRGTDNELALQSNWSASLYTAKTAVPVPVCLKDRVDFDQLWIHSGFYNYVFNKTFDDSDDPSKRKFDEVMSDITPLLKANPSYKLYLTGHSLGGALSGLVSLFLACDPDIPKPVTCLNFASPRFGDGNYLKAVQVLEKEQKLRFCRIVNDNDSIVATPLYNYYHGGFQIRLFKDPEYPPEVTFPRVEDSIYNKFGRAWGNSLITSLNLEYDHGDYRERVDQNQAYLETKNLNELYNNSDLTGFDMEVSQAYCS